MPPVRRVGEPKVERRGDRLFAIFKLSEEPDGKWRRHFTDRVVYSVFQATAAAFDEDDVSIELPREEDLLQLTESVDRFIGGANLDYEGQRPTR